MERLTKTLFVVWCLALAPTAASADPVSLAMAAINTATTALTGGTLLGGFLVGGAATVYTHFAVVSAMGFALNALSPKPATQADGGYEVNARGGIQPHAIIYGEAVVGGVTFYDEVTDGNKYLHRLIALAGHECEDVTTVYFDDEALTLSGSGIGDYTITAPSKWAGKARIRRHLGGSGQAADTALVAESDGNWTTSHVANGICYIYARFEFDRDAFPNGVPVVTAKVKGRKVYNPDTTATEWTDNAALCVRDYFTADFGLSADASAINDTAYIAAAATCAESVVTEEGTESRYTINGAFTTQSTPKSILTSMHAHMAGFPTYAQGQWSSVVGEWTAPTKTLTADDLRSPISVTPRISRSANFNGVVGAWRSEATNWKSTTYPAVLGSGFVDEDGGTENLGDLDLLLADSSARCQRLAKIALFKNRQQMTVTASFGLNAVDVAVGEIIQLTYDRWGWDEKTFECVGWTLNITAEGEPLVDLVLRETSADVYDWDKDADEASFASDDTNLPNAFITSAPTTALSSELRVLNQHVAGVLIIECSASDVGFVENFEVEFRKSSDTAWINLGLASGGKFEALDVEDTFYDVRARTVNVFGVRSAWVQQDDFEVAAFADPPSDVTDFAIGVVGGIAHLSWTASPDLDLSHYRIRHSAKLTGANFDEATTVIARIARPATSVSLPARSGTYFIQAYDKVGNASLAPPSVITNVLEIEGLNSIVTLTEHAAFTGVKSNTAVVDSIYLAIDDTSAGAPTGTYNFALVTGEACIDLGAKYTSRCWSTIDFLRDDAGGGLFDAASGLFDSATGLFDGQVYSDIDVTCQISLTDDDPTASPTWGAWTDMTVGDFAARAMRFRVVLNSETSGATPKIEELTVNVDMPDRTIAANDLVSGTSTSGYDVVFNPAFKELNGLGIAAQGMATGDYYDITSKSATGFTIEFFNSGGTTVSRTFDYVAKGYGKEI